MEKKSLPETLDVNLPFTDEPGTVHLLFLLFFFYGKEDEEVAVEA